MKDDVKDGLIFVGLCIAFGVSVGLVVLFHLGMLP